MLVGLPASGKTTLRNKLKFIESELPVILSSDDYIQAHADEQEKTYNEIFKDFINHAEAYVNSNLLDAIRYSKNILDDRTNLTVKSRARKLSRIPSNYNKYCIYVSPAISDEEWLSRLNSRPDKIIPRNVLESMLYSVQNPTEKEGFKKVFLYY